MPMPDSSVSLCKKKLVPWPTPGSDRLTPAKRKDLQCRIFQGELIRSLRWMGGGGNNVMPMVRLVWLSTPDDQTAQLVEKSSREPGYESQSIIISLILLHMYIYIHKRTRIFFFFKFHIFKHSALLIKIDYNICM